MEYTINEMIDGNRIEVKRTRSYRMAKCYARLLRERSQYRIAIYIER